MVCPRPVALRYEVTSAVTAQKVQKMSAVMEASLMLKLKLLILIGLLGIGSAEDLENQFCPAECRDCDELGNCLTCKDYKYLQLYDCVDQCSPGFYPDADQCLECPWSCESCSSADVST